MFSYLFREPTLKINFFFVGFFMNMLAYVNYLFYIYIKKQFNNKLK